MLQLGCQSYFMKPKVKKVAGKRGWKNGNRWELTEYLSSRGKWSRKLEAMRWERRVTHIRLVGFETVNVHACCRGSTGRKVNHAKPLAVAFWPIIAAFPCYYGTGIRDNFAGKVTHHLLYSSLHPGQSFLVGSMDRGGKVINITI